MSRRACRNCKVTILSGVLCIDCVRMIVATVASELILLGGAVFWNALW